MESPAEAAPFERLGPARAASPVVISVAHAGRVYPPALLASSRIGAGALRQLEDRLVDRLAAPLAGDGHGVIAARLARAWIDLNRSERELDPAMVAPPPAAGLEHTAKVRGGLGLIPRRLVGAGDIYRAPIAAEDVRSRVRDAYRPFHAALSDALDAARRRCGIAILLDCHSMPPLTPRAGEPGVTLVIGDRDGTSAAAPFAELAAETARAHGCRVARNAPYAGGHILARHGDPARGIHALQLELCRSRYLDAALQGPGPGFAAMSAMLRAIAGALAEAALAAPEALAAE